MMLTHKKSRHDAIRDALRQFVDADTVHKTWDLRDPTLLEDVVHCATWAAQQHDEAERREYERLKKRFGP